MAYKRFFDEIDLARRLAKESLTGTRGRVTADIRQQVQELSAWNQFVRDWKLPGMSSDYARVAQESHFIPILRSSVFLPAWHEITQQHFASVSVQSSAISSEPIDTIEKLTGALEKGREIKGLLVENHYIGIVWVPQYSAGEAAAVIALHAIKLAALAAATVATAGAAAPSLVAGTVEAVNSIQSVYELAQLVYETGAELYDAYDEAVERVQAIQAVAREPQNGPTIPHRRPVDFSSANWQARDARSARGLDTSQLVQQPDNERTREVAANAEAMMRNMAFIVVQQIRPVRSNVYEKNRPGGVMDPQVRLRTPMNLRDPVLVARLNRPDLQTGIRYTAVIEAFSSACIRIGPTVRDVVAGAAQSIQNMDDQKLRNIVFPWDLRGIDGAGLYLQKLRDFGTSAPLYVRPCSATFPLLIQDWSERGWTLTGERHEIEVSIDPAQVSRINAMVDQRRAILAAAKHAVDARNQRLSAQAAQAAAAAANAERLRLEQLRAAARNRFVMQASEFASRVEEKRRFWQSVPPILLAVVQHIDSYGGIPIDDFAGRYSYLLVIKTSLERFASIADSDDKGRYLALTSSLKAAVEQELASLDRALSDPALRYDYANGAPNTFGAGSVPGFDAV